MKPLLANPALKPAAADVQAATAQAQDLLRAALLHARCSGSGPPSAINAKVVLPGQRHRGRQAGVVAMRIDDTVGPDVDPGCAGLVVVFNAAPTAVTQKVPGLAGATLSLSPVQAAGSDPSSRPPPGTQPPARPRSRRAPWRCSSSEPELPRRPPCRAQSTREIRLPSRWTLKPVADTSTRVSLMP